MGDDFKGVNGSGLVNVMEGIVVEEFAGGWVKMNSILGVLVGEEAEFVPVSCLPGARYVLVGKEAEVDVFGWELELVHENAGIALIDSDLLVSVNSNEGKADLLDVNVVNCGMGKDVVGVPGD